MAKQTADGHNASDAWEQIDGTVNNVIGKRVFYNDPVQGKCLAFVTGVTGKRSPVVRDGNENIVSGGQNIDILTVFPNRGGAPFSVEAPLSGDRKAGTYALANDGDLTDAPNSATPRPEPEVVETVPDTATGNTAPFVAPTPVPPVHARIEGDEDGDGDVDKNDKRLRKQREGRG